MTKKKPAKKAKKKLAGNKADKMILDDIGNEPVMKSRILAVIQITPEVEEILKSNEAKLYITAIDRAAAKLQAMIDREAVVRRHPSHAQSNG